MAPGTTPMARSNTDVPTKPSVSERRPPQHPLEASGDTASHRPQHPHDKVMTPRSDPSVPLTTSTPHASTKAPRYDRFTRQAQSKQYDTHDARQANVHEPMRLQRPTPAKLYVETPGTQPASSLDFQPLPQPLPHPHLPPQAQAHEQERQRSSTVPNPPPNPSPKSPSTQSPTLSQRLLTALVNKPTLSRTWEKKSFAEQFHPRSGREDEGGSLTLSPSPVLGAGAGAGAGPGGAMDMGGRGSGGGETRRTGYTAARSRPTSFYASPADIAAYRPLPMVAMVEGRPGETYPYSAPVTPAPPSHV